jgi:uncharacterized membrane protein YbhN (UPF0104 family)
LCFWTGIDLAAIEEMLVRADPTAVVLIALLMGFNSFLAGEKWRLVVSRLEATEGRSMPRQLYFSLSAIGVSLGQFLPSQVSTALVRTIGARAYGRQALQRGAGATLFEQSFDLLAAILFAVVTVLVIITGGGALEWALSALAATIIGFALCAIAAPAAGSLSRGLSALPPWLSGRRIRGSLADLAGSSLLRWDMTFRLFALSMLRLGVLVLVGVASARALSFDIPLWHLAAIFPFSVLAVALALTPGALGVTEWTLSSVLVALGTPFQVAAQWAVGTRILAILATSLVGMLALLMISFLRWSARSGPGRAD